MHGTVDAVKPWGPLCLMHLWWWEGGRVAQYWASRYGGWSVRPDSNSAGPAGRFEWQAASSLAASSYANGLTSLMASWSAGSIWCPDQQAVLYPVLPGSLGRLQSVDTNLFRIAHGLWKKPDRHNALALLCAPCTWQLAAAVDAS
jgi:hypothetical protein